MATKSNAFSYHIAIKIIALILLGVMIFTFIVSATFFIEYSHYIDRDYYYQTYDFDDAVADIFHYTIHNEPQSVRRIARSAEYTAYDASGQIISGLSTVNRQLVDYSPDEYAFILTRDDQTVEFKQRVPARSFLAGKNYNLPPYHVFHAPKDGERAKAKTYLVTFKLALQDDQIGRKYDGFIFYQKAEKLMLIALFASFIVGLILAYYLIVTTGKSSKHDQVALNLFDKIPGEIIVISDALIIIFMFSVLLKIIYSLELIFSFSGLSVSFLIASLTLTLLTVYGFLTLMSLARSIKAKQFVKRFIILRLFTIILSFFNSLFGIDNWRSRYSIKALLYLLGYGLFNALMAIVIINVHSSQLAFISLLLLLAVNVFAVAWLKKQLNSLRQIINFTSDAVNSGGAVVLDNQQLAVSFRDFANDICALKDGLSSAVEQAIKNERMRGELITNVTHDLKNPLTSIISYADLLSKEELATDDARQYVTVITEKSNRLKELIDHLVEASKAASGIAEIKREAVDLIALAKQVEGEYHAALAERELQFIIQTKLQIAMVNTDTSYYTRILDNLFSNIVKYAMPGTRVYCSIEADNGYRLCLKNVSAEPLTISEDELMERFVRGDQSRSTEGNGLGLSIAKSLALALDTELTIELDGDLFKACLHHKIESV